MTKTQTQTDELVVAEDRDESEPCEAGTPGCCVRHSATSYPSCETW